MTEATLMGAATTDQTTALDPSVGAAPKKDLPPVKLRSAHDFMLTEWALTDRIDTLKALAKKARDEGYLREASNMDADAAALEHGVLPQLRNQHELKLVSDEQLTKQIAGAIRVYVHRAFDGLGDKKVTVTAEGMTRRRDRLVDALADRIVAFARDLANASYQHGYQVRTLDAESLAASVAGALSVTSTVN